MVNKLVDGQIETLNGKSIEQCFIDCEVVKLYKIGEYLLFKKVGNEYRVYECNLEDSDISISDYIEKDYNTGEYMVNLGEVGQLWIEGLDESLEKLNMNKVEYLQKPKHERLNILKDKENKYDTYVKFDSLKDFYEFFTINVSILNNYDDFMEYSYEVFQLGLTNFKKDVK